MGEREEAPTGERVGVLMRRAWKYLPIAAVAILVVAVNSAMGASTTAHPKRVPLGLQRLCSEDHVFCGGHWVLVGSDGRWHYVLNAHLGARGGAHAAGVGQQFLNNWNWGCMSSGGAGGNSGATATLYPCYWNANQTWDLMSGYFPLSIMIENMGSAAGACLNNKGGSRSDYNVQNLWPCGVQEGGGVGIWQQYIASAYSNGGILIQPSGGVACGATLGNGEAVTSNGSTSAGIAIEEYQIRWNANQEWGNASATAADRPAADGNRPGRAVDSTTGPAAGC
jgi:hypothetical protein